jgi:hypothetical protein
MPSSLHDATEATTFGENFFAGIGHALVSISQQENRFHWKLLALEDCSVAAHDCCPFLFILGLVQHPANSQDVVISILDNHMTQLPWILLITKVCHVVHLSWNCVQEKV